MNKSKLQKNLVKNAILGSLSIIKKLYLIICVTIFINCSHDKGDTLYVNVNYLELLDKPFGIKKKTLEMNDTLVLVKKMSDHWRKVAVGTDTLFFKDDPYESIKKNDKFSYSFNYHQPKIEETPFNRWKALKGQEVILNHPKGFFEASIILMLKNGDKIKVFDYNKNSRIIKFSVPADGYKEIPVEWVKIDWKKILKKYPKLKEK